MKSTKFAFALLAGENLDKVARTLKSIAAQEVEPGIETMVMIAHDNADLSEDWVKTVLSDSNMEVCLLPLPLADTPQQSHHASMLTAMAATIPETVDWVWTLADEASLYSKFSLAHIFAELQRPAHQSIGFAHACLASKSYDTGYTQLATVRHLCETHGYFEILGSLSSTILAADTFRIAFGRHLADIADQARKGNIRITPFTHCQLLYLALADNDGLLIDKKLVTQEQTTSFEAADEVSASKRMFTIAGELIELANCLEADQKWDMHFFRFGQRNIWTELLRHQSGNSRALSVNISQQDPELVSFIDNWQVLLSLADHVSDKDAASIIRNVVTNGIKYTLELLSGDETSVKKLENFFASQLTNDLVYPSTLLRPDQIMQIMRKSA